MNIIFLTPGTGSYHCGVCMRDNALALELRRLGHDAIMLPLYMPLTLDEESAAQEMPIFFGGVSVYLQQLSPIFRHTPRWLDRWLAHPKLLKLLGRNSGATRPRDLGALTHSMLLGMDGRQAKEVESLVAWMREHLKPDVIWLSTALLAGLAKPLSEALGVPVCCSLLGEDLFMDSLGEPWSSRCWATLAECVPHLALCAAPSRFFGELMAKRMAIPAEKLRIIYSGISMEGFQSSAPEVSTPSEPQPPTIGYMAMFGPTKGLDLVVDAFIELRKRGHFPTTRLRCGGSLIPAYGDYLDALKRRLREAGLEADAEFQPNVSREEKIALLRSLTLLTVPPNYDEAFGLYLAEAWAAGVPVVQPATGAFPELIAATDGGIIFQPRTAKALADAWESLLGDPERRATLARNGRCAAEERFTSEAMARAYVEATLGAMSTASKPMR